MSIPEVVVFSYLSKMPKDVNFRWACRCGINYLTVTEGWGWIKQFDFEHKLKDALRDPGVWALFSSLSGLCKHGVYKEAGGKGWTMGMVGMVLVHMSVMFLPGEKVPSPEGEGHLECKRWLARQPMLDRLCGKDPKTLCEFDLQRMLALLPTLTSDALFEKADVLALIPKESFSVEGFFAGEDDLDMYLSSENMAPPNFYVSAFLGLTELENRYGAYGETVISALVEYALHPERAERAERVEHAEEDFNL